MLAKAEWPLHRQLACFVTGAVLAAGALGLTAGGSLPATAAPVVLPANAPAGPSVVAALLEELRPVTLSGAEVAGTVSFPVNFQLRPGGDGGAAEELQIITYTVREGDTLWQISRNFQTDEHTIANLNPDVDPDLVRPGDKIRILANFQGAVYTVESGDSLDGIARDFGLTIDAIAQANKIADVNAIRIGQSLILPGGRYTGRSAVASRSGGRAATPPPPRYIWPLNGVITSEFGPRWGSHHPGLDIAAPSGTPVVAARAGRVVQLGWDGSYGQSVILDHGDGVRTRYAHASAYLVNHGDWVERGEPVIRVGSTGFSTGPHLHFEVIIAGQPANPRAYLP